ncbi:hypothetical protein GCM10027598_46210 [Amycolatopsis oliviviridis]|uniref:Uncharacterized protein n=1 Tax=Amycolatopsis oliviviridis TaxID=1471590 RepID=A0ABQ3LH31_9PSEU|nr:hypothetical protein [Amycolatopsis oliviviridis]GHH08629.1 hypothetical protein GCM10017790_15630 [Amycolatopsis oliviviridis]
MLKSKWITGPTADVTGEIDHAADIDPRVDWQAADRWLKDRT